MLPKKRYLLDSVETQSGQQKDTPFKAAYKKIYKLSGIHKSSRSSRWGEAQASITNCREMRKIAEREAGLNAVMNLA